MEAEHSNALGRPLSSASSFSASTILSSPVSTIPPPGAATGDRGRSRQAAGSILTAQIVRASTGYQLTRANSTSSATESLWISFPVVSGTFHSKRVVTVPFSGTLAASASSVWPLSDPIVT